jgi:lipopolysaccharide export system protein LptA
VHVFEGNVILTQGTLTIRGDKLVVTQDAAGFQNGVATAAGKGLATFRQRRDGSTEYVEGEAERIEYDSRSEKARLFNRAKVTSGGDQVTGHYIEYDAITENYLATNAPGSKPGCAGRPGARGDPAQVRRRTSPFPPRTDHRKETA